MAAAQHRSEGHDLLLTTAFFARLLVITLGADTFDDVLAIELLLHATERTVNGLVFADFDFDGHVVRRVVNGKRRRIGKINFASSNVFYPLKKLLSVLA